MKIENVMTIPRNSKLINNNFIYVFGENDCVERHKTLHLRYQGPNQIHGQTSSNFGNT